MESVNYCHIVDQTPEERMAMYMKCSKKELAQMVIECNRLLGSMRESIPLSYEGLHYEEGTIKIDYS